MNASDTIVLGRIVSPYGVKGWVHIKPFGDDPAAWREMPVWRIADAETGPWREIALAGFRLHGDGVVAAFDGIADRDAAEEQLQGRWIGATRAMLPAPGENEFYWADLIGLAVVTHSGLTLGRVEALIETGANDVLQVVSEELADDGKTPKRHLLPFVAAVVKTVDLANQRLTVDWEADW